ncbi:ABC transporter substrate-binding protein [Rhizobium sp. L1K21]|uniref:substrate-binding periplasmic protein n=1 Tax=Rhizobium sp. L1K21 TaxID=2954933 RepID=UPI0020927397|nr:ABC transporter substrate-binding protein [Rhizobium sp. L1K21]MCO6185463.1 ABC transporter substrate-binding protein [Rhizobium sp. L1K21]
MKTGADKEFSSTPSSPGIEEPHRHEWTPETARPHKWRRKHPATAGRTGYSRIPPPAAKMEPHMKMKSIFGLKTAVFCAVSLVSATQGHADDKLQILTEDYAPMNFLRDGKIVGASTEQVELLLERAKIDYSLEMVPWARGYALTQNEKNNCLYSTAHTDERNAKFKWVEPLVVTSSVLIAKAGSDIHPLRVEDAWQYTVGTQRADVTYDLLVSFGFPKIDIAANFDMTLKKLLAGRIDLMVASDGFFRDAKENGADIEIAFVLSQQINSIACGKKVPDEVITKMQTALDSLIADGTQEQILKKYGMAIE